MDMDKWYNFNIILVRKESLEYPLALLIPNIHPWLYRCEYLWRLLLRRISIESKRVNRSINFNSSLFSKRSNIDSCFKNRDSSENSRLELGVPTIVSIFERLHLGWTELGLSDLSKLVSHTTRLFVHSSQFSSVFTDGSDMTSYLIILWSMNNCSIWSIKY